MSADRIKTLLLSTKRQGMEALIDHMEENGFFTAPCSTSHHLSKEGGLAEHSYNVYCAVSYTHLDVYKRQAFTSSSSA